jgi:hypothetical protein
MKKRCALKRKRKKKTERTTSIRVPRLGRQVVSEAGEHPPPRAEKAAQAKNVILTPSESEI